MFLQYVYVFFAFIADQREPEHLSYFEQQKAKSPKSPTSPLVKSTPSVWKPGQGPSLVKKEYKPVRLDTSPKPDKRFNQKVKHHKTLLCTVYIQTNPPQLSSFHVLYLLLHNVNNCICNVGQLEEH